MAANTKAPKKHRVASKPDRLLKRKRQLEDLEELQKSVDALDVKTPLKTFAEVPLSQPTAAGLRDSHFETLTDIQSRALPAALKGSDILGAAKTGSGKTLAFLIPVLEKLYRARWTEYDGLGALIISPTRELSAQIFEVLRKIGRHHAFSAGLVIGGKSLKEEAERVGRMNILVCTPGRMLQHLDQSASLDVSNLQILVLDEADRIMDMGFQSAVDALVEHLPKARQTLLFSATQSKKVSDLARLSLKDPEYIAVHESAESATPSRLQQHYIVTPLPEKLDTLYGFVRANLKSKMIVFFSSGKQVRFAFESFRHLQPGIPLLHLHGRQRQVARHEITSRFTAAKHACLFATDVVARGVDFPSVDWVIQADAPEDVDTYIHRVGRTARYESNGRAVLFLDPSEEPGMLKRLEHKKVPIQKVNVREKKKQSIRDQLQSMCWQQYDIKYLAQKAFISYTRSIHQQKDKEVFKLDELDLEGYAKSLGLAGAPQIRFQKGEDAKRLKNASRAMLSSGSEDEDGDQDDLEAGAQKKKPKKKEEVRTKVQKMFERTNQDVLSEHYRNLVVDDDEDEGGVPGAAGTGGAARGGEEAEDFFSTKRVLRGEQLTEAAGEGRDGDELDADGNPLAGKVIKLDGVDEFVVDSKRREKLLKSKKKLLKFKSKGTKLVFDDDGNAQPLYVLQGEDDFRAQGPAEELRRRFVDEEAGQLRAADAEDKELVREKRREKRLKRKARERGEEMPAGSGTVVRLGAPDGSDDDSDGDGGYDDGEDPLALLRSLPLPGEPRSGSESAGEEDGGASPPRKRPRRFSGVVSDDAGERAPAAKKGKGAKKSRVIEAAEPETLEDLEALATGLLEG